MEKIEKKEIIKDKLPDGLIFIKNFLTSDEAKEMIEFLDQEKWSTDIPRRTIQYGHKYNYHKNHAKEECDPVPKFFDKVAKKLEKYYPQGIDQIIVNEYFSGQGIAPHYDNPEYFGEVVSSITLLCPCVMNFYECVPIKDLDVSVRRELTGKVYEVFLEVNSLVIMTGESRYQHLHEIPKDKKYDEKYRRVSVTFRKMRK